MSEINLNGGSKKIILNGTTYYAGGVSGSSPTPPTPSIDADIDRLVYVEYVGNDTEEIPTVDDMTQDTDYSEYLSYSTSTKKFTVLKEFNALIVPWVYQYREAQSTRARGQFYINDTLMVSFKCGSTYSGEYAGKTLSHHFSVGDTFYSYTPSSDGYPQQFLKVYNINDISSADLNNALMYEDENV